ncbi:MAG TPA: AMP-binding protein [Longimicrobium sp.]|jgi:long-subunit acyl-CoA synthetase (AMP-forming)|uniref:AMP-binding protein n=1 Tax=Longimicrobium sp. TaxID=2029185 RepID=UPI002ED8082A
MNPHAGPGTLNRVVSLLPSAQNRLTCIRGGRRMQVPFSELDGPVRAMRALLHARGLRSGDRVGILGANSYEFIVLDLACLASGLVSVPFDPAHPGEALAAARALGVSVLFVDQEPAPAAGMQLLPLVVPEPAGEAGDPAPPTWTFGPDDMVTVKFTSGSTQRPKAIAPRRQSVDATLEAVQEMFRHGPADTVLVFLPLYLLQQRYWIYSAVLFGYDLVVVPPHHGVGALLRERPTVVMGVPEFYEKLMAALAAETADAPDPSAVVREATGGRVRYLWTGSAAMRQETLDFYQRAGIPVYQGYGTNETCIVAKNHPGANRPGSAGRVLPHQEVIVEPDGHLLVRSGHPVSDRYLLADPDDDGATFLDGGVVATGDLGYLDEDGYLFITGRRKELIVFPSGRKLHPSVIEDRLKAVPGVRHCMVYGADRPYLVALVDAAPPGPGEPELRAALDEINRDLPYEAQVRAARVVPDGFSRENGTLTSQYKLKRAEIATRFSAEISQLYQEADTT